MKYKKNLLFLSFIFLLSGTHSFQAAPSLKWIKKNVMSVSPFTLFFEVKPRDEWLDSKDTLKNSALKIAAHSAEGVFPSVGNKLKKFARKYCVSLLGKKNKWIVGPVKISSETVSYYGVNGMYSFIFAKGDPTQRLLFTLYKLFIRKAPARYLTKKFLAIAAWMHVTDVLNHGMSWWVNKKAYHTVIADVAKKAVKASFEILINEYVGCYIIPHIDGSG